MKKIFIISCFALALASCSSRQEKMISRSSDSYIMKSRLQLDKSINENDLIGIWWDTNDKNAPTATFMINDSTIVYPDQEGKSDFKYQIKNDSMIIYFEGFISTSKIEKLTLDTLVLITNGNKLILYKGKI